ncbi:TonB-dependent receptor [Novosphingobium kaempferiae]|uniref:TonB-dependent receptor n=1 Tax=Novosphingobium kaempferiae TaxID=2896849 RepID=UPI001E5AE894|nr:TonB-dependent receptor [Novosphingobium kaempferiae]
MLCNETIRHGLLRSTTMLAGIGLMGAVGTAHAQAAQEQDAGIGDIIVTAQKRSQNLNDVGMSIAAIGSEQINTRGIARPEDLTKIVPSLTVTSDYRDTPVYTLRGVGFFEQTLAAAPTVSMYVDQVPLVFPILARGAALDLERLEVLKGPQGTTFGQNSTGGLINYIAAKPTADFSAGLDWGYARFGQFDANAFVSGPIATDVSIRVAGATTQGGAWQKSATRDDTLGDQNFTRGRVILDAQPSSDLKLSLMVNGWIDKGDTFAGRALEELTTTGNTISPEVGVSIAAQRLHPRDPRIADWTPGAALRHDDWFIQGSLRADYDLLSNVQLTSITAYSDFSRDSEVDGDGTSAADFVQKTSGRIRDFYQELRGSGEFLDKRMHLNAGVSYQRSKIADIYMQQQNPAGGGLQVSPFGAFLLDDPKGFTRISTLAAFASGDYQFSDRLQVEAGVRYTSSRTHYRGCTADGGDGGLANIVGSIQEQVLGRARTTAPGECITLNDAPDAVPADQFASGFYEDDLDQDNVSWRANLNWKPFADDKLLYANVSRGYKAGSFVMTGANLSSQLAPVRQERLTAYELGFKLPIAGRSVQINGAAFYYDYKGKQIRGRFVNIFGVLERLSNIPRSDILGAEGQVLLRPFEGLSASANATYVRSRVRSNPDGSDYTTFPSRAHDPAAAVPVTGMSFPFTPKFSASADIGYDWAVSDGLKASIGASLTYQGRSRATLTQADPGRPADTSLGARDTYNDPTFSLPAYTLLDLRASLASPDGKYTVSIFGRNVTNKFYATSTTLVLDTIVQYTGMPATYGIKLSVRY